MIININQKGTGSYLNELHGCMTQCPEVFWRMRSLTNALRLPNNFMARRLSVGWNHDCNWLFKKFAETFSETIGMLGIGSSFGVPYNDTSSKCTWRAKQKIRTESISFFFCTDSQLQQLPQLSTTS